ncbi:hypothetical protein PK28_09415 [Hymenobacter sp. DG25B]|uniref:hypothetical protein n=1 Tax=Hymenobacter sp. DG25B TaxID=1385664 RepID=UPI000540FEF8|nr:hypothetical protein [Hymenobacter sp. DG25B]AIZ63855.1 hypothetical protein PK28_09415 [Hymenobacter sp. DG25B]
MQAQPSYVQEFAAATVVLATGDTLRGPLVLHHNEDIIRLTMPNQTVRTFTPVAVEYFTVQGEVNNNLTENQPYHEIQPHPTDLSMRQIGYSLSRGYSYTSQENHKRALPLWLTRLDTLHLKVFRTYRWNPRQANSNFTSPVFFEQLSHGPVYLLLRQELGKREVREYSNAGTYNQVTRTYRPVKDMLYLGTPKGQVVPLPNPRKNLLSFYHAKSRQIEQYARQNKLDFNNTWDLTLLVNYANSLITAEAD